MSDNVFTRRASRKQQGTPNLEIVGSEDHHDEDDNLPDYEAAELGQGHTRLKIIFKDGTLILASYGYITKVVATSHQYLSIVTSDTVFTFEGRGLLPLIDLLQDDKIRVIRTYRPDLYAPPLDDEPLITDIIAESHKEAERMA